MKIQDMKKSNIERINWSIDEKKIDFVEIKIYFNKNIEWHCMHLELDWIWFKIFNSIQFNSTIELNFNWKEMDANW
jgi:hypothetical protein